MIGWLVMGVGLVLAGLVPSVSGVLVAAGRSGGSAYTFMSGAVRGVDHRRGRRRAGRPRLPARRAVRVRGRDRRASLGVAVASVDLGAARRRRRRDHARRSASSLRSRCRRPASGAGPRRSGAARSATLQDDGGHRRPVRPRAAAAAADRRDHVLRGRLDRGLRPALGGAPDPRRRPAGLGGLDPVVWFGRHRRRLAGARARGLAAARPPLRARRPGAARAAAARPHRSSCRRRARLRARGQLRARARRVPGRLPRRAR